MKILLRHNYLSKKFHFRYETDLRTVLIPFTFHNVCVSLNPSMLIASPQFRVLFFHLYASKKKE